ncbi:MAG: 3-hydroxyacyl-ACP dehydratase FabZ family protein [Planctomycetia bacterium]|nr:3-hydroxyacyl-ACP dehydratase FabZ family protein [Planctomycetia bacterium]
MAKKPTLLNLTQIDMSRTLATQEDIRKENPHRFEMEMLTGILYEDLENVVCAGYQDVSENAFWVRGHMPGYPIMPGVLICECAAQLASYYAKKMKYLDQGIMAFGGLDNVKFRGQVRPGDRLILVVKLLKGKPNVMMVLQFEAVVNGEVVADGELRGVAIRDAVIELPEEEK